MRLIASPASSRIINGNGVHFRSSSFSAAFFIGQVMCSARIPEKRTGPQREPAWPNGRSLWHGMAGRRQKQSGAAAPHCQLKPKVSCDRVHGAREEPCGHPGSLCARKTRADGHARDCWAGKSASYHPRITGLALCRDVDRVTCTDTNKCPTITVGQIRRALLWKSEARVKLYKLNAVHR